MSKKNNKTLIILLLLVGVVGYFIFSGGIGVGKEKYKPVSEGESSGGLELGACALGPDGQCMNTYASALQLGGYIPEGQYFAYIETGGVICYGSTGVGIDSTLTKSGTVSSVNVESVAGSAEGYSSSATSFNNNIQSDMTETTFVLGGTAREDFISMPDGELDRNTLSTETPFKMDIVANYIDAVGTEVPISDISGTIYVRVMDDFCPAAGGTPSGTAWDTCADGYNTYNFCQAGTIGCSDGVGVQGTLVSDCRGLDGSLGGGDDCACASGYTCQSNGACTQDKCSDNTIYGECSTVSWGSSCSNDDGEYGSYCKCIGGTLVPDYCNECGCVDDYYENQEDSCSSGTDTATCVYDTYTGDVSVGLS